MAEGALQFVGVVPDYAIRDGCMFISTADWSLVMPLRTFERGMAKAAKVIAGHYAKSAEVLPIKRRGG